LAFRTFTWSFWRWRQAVPLARNIDERPQRMLLMAQDVPATFAISTVEKILSRLISGLPHLCFQCLALGTHHHVPTRQELSMPSSAGCSSQSRNSFSLNFASSYCMLQISMMDRFICLRCLGDQFERHHHPSSSLITVFESVSYLLRIPPLMNGMINSFMKLPSSLV
jgi:hypothetical protein